MNAILKRIEADRSPIPCLFYPQAAKMGLSVGRLLTDPERQAEALVSIGAEYPVGAVVRMTELWCEAAAFGMDCSFPEGDFPRLGEPLCADAEELEGVAVPRAENPVTAPLVEAVRLAVSRLEKPLIVGVTGPYTLGSVLCGSEDFMMNCMTEPEAVETFLDRLTAFLTGYILAYKEAGAAAVMVAEPSIAMISPAMAEAFSSACLEKILEAVQDDSFSVIYHNCGAVMPHLDSILALPAHGFHFGSDVDLGQALERAPEDTLILGNVEPRLFLGAKPEEIRHAAGDAAQRGGRDNFRLSTGCDLSPASRGELLDAFFAAAAGQ